MKEGFTRLMISIFFLGLTFLILISCGGGGGTTSGGTNSYIGFTTEDFSGKSLYLVDGSIYQLATFYPDGTAKASNMMTSGTPVLLPGVAALWAVTNGVLIIKDLQGEDTIRYNLLNEDNINRYFRVSKDSLNGVVNIVGMFYDQVTGLNQAQDFVANNMHP